MMKRWIVLLAAAVFTVLQASPLGAITLYDNFSTDHLKKSMWMDHYTGSQYLHEFVREIDSGSLVLKLGTNEDIYPSRKGVSLATPFAAPLTGLQADVKIVEMNNDPTDSVTVFAHIAGLFYNRQFVSPAADCFDGDIWAELALGDRGNGLEAWFEVEEFDTCDNTTAITLMNQSLTTGVTLLPDHLYTLEIVYNSDTEFTFRISEGATLVGEITVNGPARMGGPHGHNGVLQACVQDDPDEYLDGYVHAEFDNVYVNGAATAYDTFNSSQINPALWSGSEYVKESVNGRARLHVKGQNDIKRSRLYPRDQYTPYLGATARIESGSTFSSEGWGRVRIGGWFYNQLHAPGSYNGREGNLWVQVGLHLNDAGALRATAVISVANDAAASSYSTVWNEDFPTTILFDIDYDLSINFTGTGFVFSCGSDVLNYTISTPIYEPNPYIRVVESVLWLDPGESGYLKGQIDDIYVQDPDYTNLAGPWAASITNNQVTSGSCGADADETFGINITQNGCEIIMTDSADELRSLGVISGSRVLMQFSELDGIDLFESWADMTLSDADNMAGERQTAITPGDCEQASNISFARVPQYTVTFTSGDNGSLTGTTTQIVNEGDDCTTMTAIADSGYVFDQWTGDYNGADNPLAMTNVTANMTITANFAADNSSGGGGGGGGGCFIQSLSF